MGDAELFGLWLLWAKNTRTREGREGGQSCAGPPPKRVHGQREMPAVRLSQATPRTDLSRAEVALAEERSSASPTPSARPRERAGCPAIIERAIAGVITHLAIRRARESGRQADLLAGWQGLVQGTGAARLSQDRGLPRRRACRHRPCSLAPRGLRSYRGARRSLSRGAVGRFERPGPRHGRGVL